MIVSAMPILNSSHLTGCIIYAVLFDLRYLMRGSTWRIAHRYTKLVHLTQLLSRIAGTGLPLDQIHLHS